MQFQIKTFVTQDYQTVFAGFNQELFIKLAPPFPPVKLLRFDGCKKGNVVMIQLNLIFFKQIWESLITENQAMEEKIYFIDEGIRLPFFLKKWKHQHIIKQENQQTAIIDNISYQSPFWLFDYFLFPLLYLLFYYRKPIYKKVFKK